MQQRGSMAGEVLAVLRGFVFAHSASLDAVAHDLIQGTLTTTEVTR